MSNNNIDIDSIRPLLEKGETVEWAAKAEPFETVNKYNKSAFTMRVIISLIAAVILIVIYAAAVNNSETVHFNIVLPVIIAAVALFMAFRPYLDARSLKKKLTFIVTNKNVAIREGESSLKAMPLNSIDEALFINKGDGIGDVVFGSAAIKRPYRKIVITTLVPLEALGNTEGVAGMAFYNVKGYENIKELLSPNTKISETTLG